MPEPTPPFSQAIGRIPSGLFILCLEHRGQSSALLASWVQQCGFDPPRLSLALKTDRPVISWLSEGCDLTVNILPEGEKRLLGHFGKGFGPGDNPFVGIELRPELGRAPVLAAALAFLTCRPVQTVPAGDHTIVVCDILGGGVLNEGRPAVHVRKSGLHY